MSLEIFYGIGLILASALLFYRLKRTVTQGKKDAEVIIEEQRFTKPPTIKVTKKTNAQVNPSKKSRSKRIIC